MVRVLVVGLAWLLTPGLTEVTENLWHLAVAGHTAHSLAAGDDHRPRDDEHGCSGTFHFCACHHSVTPTLAQATMPRRPGRAEGRPARFRPAPTPDPARPAPYHPPRV